jgi:hypothetical protein
VHWADEASLDLLIFLAAELSQAAVLVVATARNAVPASDAWAKASSRLGSCDRIELSGLKPAEVEQYVAEVTGLDLPDEIHRTVYAKCGGNPLFLQETARLLIAVSDRHGLESLRVEDVRVPGVAKDVLRARLSGLGWGVCEALEVACVIGQEFELPLLQSALDSGAESLLVHLDQAVRARLIAPRSRAGSYGFCHDTIRESLYEELSTARRVELHYRVAEALEGQAAGDFGVKDLAYHYYRALPRAEPERAVHYARAAGKSAMRGFAYEEAAQFYGWAIEAQRFSSDTDPRSRCEMLLAQATAVRLSGRVGESRKAIAQAIAIARQHGFADLLWDSASRLRQAVQLALVPDKLALQALEDAAKLLSDDERPLRIRVLGKLACIPPYSLSTSQSQELSARAVALARTTGNPEDLAIALTSRLHVLSGPDHIDEILAVADEIARLTPRSTGEMELTRYHAFLHRGDMAAAGSALEDFGRIAHSRRRPEALWHYLRLRGQEAMLRGDFETSDAQLHDLLVLGRRLRLNYGEMHYVMHSIVVAYERTGLALAPASAWRSQLEWATAIPSFQAHWVRFLVESGRLEDARQSLATLAHAGFDTITKDLGYLNALAHLSVSAVVLEERGHARRLYELMKPYPFHNTPNGFGYCLGSTSHYLGLTARLLGATDDAVRHLEDALGMNERMGCIAQVTRTQLALAEALGQRDIASSRSRARALLGEAMATARRLDLQPLVAQIEAATGRMSVAPSSLAKAR